jgi:hypothetical protein
VHFYFNLDDRTVDDSNQDQDPRANEETPNRRSSKGGNNAYNWKSGSLHMYLSAVEGCVRYFIEHFGTKDGLIERDSIRNG